MKQNPWAGGGGGKLNEWQMKPARAWCALMAAVTAAWMLLACAGTMRQTPRGGTGAASVAELLAAYRKMHEDKDPAPFRDLEIMLACTVADSADQANERFAAELRKLFELRLEDLKLVDLPLIPGVYRGFDYYRPLADGSVRASSAQQQFQKGTLVGKLILEGRRPDGKRVRVDPGLTVERLGERAYLYALTPVLEDAGAAITAGKEPEFCPLPLGTDEKTALGLHQERNWAKLAARLDQLEPKLRRAGP
jgi:hypothetical protein